MTRGWGLTGIWECQLAGLVLGAQSPSQAELGRLLRLLYLHSTGRWQRPPERLDKTRSRCSVRMDWTTQHPHLSMSCISCLQASVACLA